MIKVTLLTNSCLSEFSSCLMRTKFKQKAPRLEAHVVSHWVKRQYVVTTRAVLWQSQSCSFDYPLYCWAHCMLFQSLYRITTKSCSAIKASKVQVQDLQGHCVQAAAENRKLQCLGRQQEQLPNSLWDPDVWTDACQHEPAKSHQLVYLATDRQKQHSVKLLAGCHGVST